MSHSTKFHDRTNERYGKLVVVSFAGRVGKARECTWLCRCDCGQEKVVRVSHLTDKASCGCMTKELMREFRLGRTTVSSEDRTVAGVLRQYKANAKTRNITFGITKEDVKKLIFQPCFYCGKLPSNSYTKLAEGSEPVMYNGIDRYNNKEGYTPMNCVPCCWQCNESKNNRDTREFLAWVRNIYHNCAEINNPWDNVVLSKTKKSV